MERLRTQYHFYARRKKQAHTQATSFQRDFPEFAQFRRNVSEKNQVNTLTHWLLLAVFGLLTFASFPQQLLVIGIFTVITALIKGPGMILFGIVYSFLVGLFPPLGMLLSAVFFFLSLYQLTRNWRFGLTAAFFYLYPMLLVALRFFDFGQTTWFSLLASGIGLMALHFLIRGVYQEQPSSKGLAWSLVSLPYDCFLFLLPSKRKKATRLSKKMR
ncbi:hypothetical protein IV487_04115 [Enterococcus saccharolyticus]|uniref:DUF962 domain-containing protein n=1 Tax=Candidatus Enterococcus willemsii TaxID=1857215 RepID=A0ABQ6YZ02_9ENTE|nr:MULTISPECIES: hypothetical protein [Enterococcus]KAF1303606.1 hypothetical protein BAU17_06360 [Enterococcus sp. CU12B]MCD5001656.1 hypothetical protein [Enterococcus saccharolyticus]